MPDSLAALDAPTGAADCDDLLRDWLASATERFEWLKTVSGSREVAKATKLFGKRTSRARGRIALQRAYEPVAELQAIGDVGTLPYLCWVFPRPRDESRTVSINFVMVLRFEDGRVTIAAMTWTADVTHDALADALRNGERDLDAVLTELHAALLDAPAAVADVTGPLAVPAGGGWFLGVFARGMAGNEPCLTFQAQRWIPGLDPAEAAPIGAAADGGPRLSDGVLCPLRLAGAQFAPAAQSVSHPSRA